MTWWEALLTSGIGGATVSVLNWFLGRSKRDAEIRLIDSQAEKTQAESQKLLTEMIALRVEQTEALSGISERVEKAIDSADEAADAVLLSKAGGMNSTQENFALLKRALGNTTLDVSAQELNQLISLGLIRKDSGGSISATNLGRRLLARGA